MVLDPTLLLSREEWNRTVGAPMVEGKYIFFYSWAYCDEEINEIVAEYAKREWFALLFRTHSISLYIETIISSRK